MIAGQGSSNLCVCVCHLPSTRVILGPQEALAAARPSVPAAEMARLAALYDRFRGGRDPAWSASGSATARPGQRTTMA